MNRRGEMERSGARPIDRVLEVAAGVVLLSTLATAVHDVSYAWDVWYYHLPFAARLVGLLPKDAFVFHAANEARFAGLPLLAELLQGVIWRATGRVECANLVSFACVPLFAWFLRRRFQVPLALSILALLAIPLVQAHASSCYVDLPANTATSVVVLLAFEAYATGATVDDRTLAMAGLAAIVAANSKMLVLPVVLVALAALGARSLPRIALELRSAGDLGRRRAAWTIALSICTLVLVLATPLKNLAVHHNPSFPVRMNLLGYHLPGAEDPYSSAPGWLANAPGPVRFVCSLLEIGIRPLSDPWRWTVDQWMAPDSTGPRMGGFFGAYVVAELAFLGWLVARDRSRTTRVAAICFALFTALTSVMPQAHELRYYMGWMLVLVATNRWLACREGAPPWRARWLGVSSTLALVVVIVVSRGVFVYPSGSTFADLLGQKVDPRSIDGIADGERVCVRRAPLDMLWAARFHPPRRYVVKEAEEPDECRGYRPLD